MVSSLFIFNFTAILDPTNSLFNNSAECLVNITLTVKSKPNKQNPKQTLWFESAKELYRLSNRRLSAKLVPTYADRGVSRSQRGRTPMAKSKPNMSKMFRHEFCPLKSTHVSLLGKRI
jgi:hypothetical protein